MKSIGLFLLVASVALFAGCTVKTTSTSDATSTETKNVAAFCACGFEKGSEDCCKGEKCDCGYHKGSDLCCKGIDAEAAGKSLCQGCGEIAGGEKCCADDAAKCDKCGLHAGSPLCCKIEAGEEEAAK